MDEWLVSGSALGKEKENVLHRKTGLAGLACDTTLEAEAGGSQVQGQPDLQSEFTTNIDWEYDSVSGQALS